ncbi:hypothetical protein PG994_004986 [Apiospora phragmitis]|uniref:F-box domain-containing protein n=1 Tax=Apiospora phragmitis TaxID=2905665 RepID=A0ABR1VSA6_9PEZI
MDKLSFEIISLILDHLPKFKYGFCIAPYATISRQWQAVVESRTFARVCVVDLDDFKSIFSASSYRPAALRKLEFEVGLPSDGDTRAHHLQNQAAALAAITLLLDGLAACESRLHDGCHICTPSMGPINLRLGYYLEEAEDCKVAAADCEKSAAIKRYLKFQEEEVRALPKNRCVSRFRIRAKAGEAQHPLTSCQLATCFTGFQVFELQYWDPPVKRSTLRKANRSALADGITILGQLPHLSKLQIVRVAIGSHLTTLLRIPAWSMMMRQAARLTCYAKLSESWPRMVPSES